MRFLSIKKIAKEAGVSTATVSRVLNNPGYKCSSEELRERIWKIARELNYMPNEAARNLKKGITDTSQKVWYLDAILRQIRFSVSCCVSLRVRSTGRDAY